MDAGVMDTGVGTALLDEFLDAGTCPCGGKYIIESQSDEEETWVCDRCGMRVVYRWC